MPGRREGEEEMRLAALLIALILAARPLLAEGERAGDFDYYVLALSWSPTWCALEGEARDSPQCDKASGLGWVLHGLWPQHEEGWPSWCRTPQRDPPRSETAVMADIMGTPGAAWHQWQKHGRCSGLTARNYFAAARKAFESVRMPEVFAAMRQPYRLPARVVEEAFLDANPGWQDDMLTITCRQGRIQEARLCLTRDLEPRACGADVVRDCTLRDALIEPLR